MAFLAQFSPSSSLPKGPLLPLYRPQHSIRCRKYQVPLPTTHRQEMVIRDSAVGRTDPLTPSRMLNYLRIRNPHLMLVRYKTHHSRQSTTRMVCGSTPTSRLYHPSVTETCHPPQLTRYLTYQVRRRIESICLIGDSVSLLSCSKLFVV